MPHGSHGLRSARPRGSDGAWRRGRRGPRSVREIEKIQQIRLRRIAVGKVRAGIDETVFHELHDRSVIHGDVGNVVLSHERRDHHVGQPESELCGEALVRRRVSGIRARVNRD